METKQDTVQSVAGLNGPASSDAIQQVRTMEDSSGKTKHFLLVTGLSKDTSAAKLKAFFGKYGKFERLFIVTTMAQVEAERKRFAHIMVDSQERLKKLVEAANGQMLDGKCLTVSEVPENGPLSRQYVMSSLVSKVRPSRTQSGRTMESEDSNAERSMETLILTEDADDFLLETEKSEGNSVPDSTAHGDSADSELGKEVEKKGQVQDQEGNEAEALKLNKDLMDDPKDKKEVKGSLREFGEWKDRDRKALRERRSLSRRLPSRRSKFRGRDDHRRQKRKRSSSKEESPRGGRKTARSPVRKPGMKWNRVKERVARSRSPRLQKNRRTPVLGYENVKKVQVQKEYSKNRERERERRHLEGKVTEVQQQSRCTSNADLELARLARENEKLVRERQEIEREKQELLNFEKERQRLERERLEDERRRIWKARKEMEEEKRRKQRSTRMYSSSPESHRASKSSSLRFQSSFPVNTIAERIEEDRKKRNRSRDRRSVTVDRKDNDRRNKSSPKAKILGKCDRDYRREERKMIKRSLSPDGRVRQIRIHPSPDRPSSVSNVPKLEDASEYRRQTEELWKKLRLPQQTLFDQCHSTTGAQTIVRVGSNTAVNVPLLPQLPSSAQMLLGMNSTGWASPGNQVAKPENLSLGSGFPYSQALTSRLGLFYRGRTFIATQGTQSQFSGENSYRTNM